MRDLRVVGSDEGSITLEAIDGDRFRLVVDEHVKSAVRSASNANHSSPSVSPRDIQDRIRAGETVAQIVEQSGAPEEFVNKFAQPVIDELEHIVASALAIRITIAGDRFNDPHQEEFGELIAGRLLSSGADQVTWTSRRTEGGVWALTAQYSLNGHPGEALWTYEPRRFLLAPDNESAIALSNYSSGLDVVIPKLRTIAGQHPSVSSSNSFQKSESSTPSLVTLQVPVVENEVEDLPEDVSETATAPAAFRRFEPADDADSNEDELGATTTNLLEELRKRRTESSSENLTSVEQPYEDLAEDDDSQWEEQLDDSLDDVTEESTSPFEPDVDTDSQSEIEIVAEQEGLVLPEEIEQTDTKPETEAPALAEESPEPSPKRGRAPMPSWDEIVFGTKADED